MLQLTSDQIAQLDRLVLGRQTNAVTAALADAWPALVERLHDRWSAFVAAALDRGHALGLRTPGELARLASIVGLWGHGFEHRAGFEWAAEILADARRSPALKLHQLVTGTRAALAALPSAGHVAAVATPAAFDAALAALDRALAARARVRDIFLDAPPAPSQRACDIGALRLDFVEPAARLAYRWREPGWQRVAVARIDPAAVHHDIAPQAPIAIALLAAAPEGAPGAARLARANLRVQTLAACDDRTHPEVVLRDAGSRVAWRGADAAQLALALRAPAPPAIDPARGPEGIGHAAAPHSYTLSIQTCGVRDAGAPFGTWNATLTLHDATQRLLEVSHASLPALDLPASTTAPAPAGTHCRLEADGIALDATAWERQWGMLQPACVAGAEKLLNAWARSVAEGSARLEGELAPLVGQAGITWGWQRVGPDRLAHRAVGRLDWTALALDLRLSGALRIAGASARLTLHAQDKIEWRIELDQTDDETSRHGLAAAQRQWRVPFALSAEPQVGHDPAMLTLVAQPEPLRGAIAGQCGLRPRPDGRGWQWFYTLRTEAVHAEFVRADPLLGEQRVRRELLPALTLVDWSAG